MASYWDLLPAGAWPTQPYVSPYDPMQAPWAVDTTQASPFAQYLTSQYGASAKTSPPESYSAPDVADLAHYRRMADEAKRTYDAAMWAFGPPSLPQSPSMRQAPVPFNRAAQPAAAADAPGPLASGVNGATSAPWPVPAANASPWPVEARDQSNAPAGSLDAPPAPALAAAVGNRHIERQGERIRATAATRPLPPEIVRDIPVEIYQAGADALHDVNAGLNPFSAAARAGFDKRMKAATPGDALAASWESQKRVGRGLLGIPAFFASPVTGASRSLIGHPLHWLDATMRDLAVRVSGEDKVRQAEEARGDRPGGRTYEDAKTTADKLMMAIGPRGGMRRPPPAPMTRALPPPIEPIIGEGGGVPRVDARSVPPPPINPANPASDSVRPPTLPLPALPAPPIMLALPPPRPQLALPAPRTYPLLSGPPPGTQESWKGLINSRPVAEGGETPYRTWGGDSALQRPWLSFDPPISSNAARRDYSLWPGNSAPYVSRVRVPGKTQIQWGTAAEAFDQPGGGTQAQLLQKIPAESYRPGKLLPPE